MTDTTTVVAMPDNRSSNLDWGAIIGGALIATALSFVLFAFGSGAGVASVSPYSFNNPSVTTLSITAAAYFCVVMIGSFLAGGYFAGRFRRLAGDTASAEETSFRDGAHGLLMWALSLLLGLVLAFGAASMAARSAASVAGSAASGAARIADTGNASAIVDRMLRPAAPDATGGAQRNEDPRAEIGRIFASSATSGEINNADRDYMAGIVAAQARIPPEEARKRVDTAIENAKEAADKARKLAVALAFMIGAVSILSAGAAYWAATAGGRERDQNVWR